MSAQQDELENQVTSKEQPGNQPGREYLQSSAKPKQHPRIIDVTGRESILSIFSGTSPLSEHWKNSKERRDPTNIGDDQ